MPYREVDETERRAYRRAFEMAMARLNVLNAVRGAMLAAVDEVLAGEIDDLGQRIDTHGLDVAATMDVQSLLMMVN